MKSLRQLSGMPVLFTVALIVSPCAFAADVTGTPSTVVASQGGANITLDDLDAFAKGVPEAQRPGFFNSPERIQNLISSLLVQKQLAAEARKNGLADDPVVRKQIEIATDEALSKARMRQFRDDMKLPDFSLLAQEEFIAHKERYVVKASVDVKHVLIGTKTRSEQDAKALAETVEKEARANPQQFDALVEKFSDDPSKSDNQGLMKDAGNDGKYLREFAEAAAQLAKPGDISPIVKTSYGFHVLKLIDRTSETMPKFEEVKDTIVAKLRSEYIDKQVKTHTDTLRNLPVDANPELVASLRTRYGASATAPAPTR